MTSLLVTGRAKLEGFAEAGADPVAVTAFGPETEPLALPERLTRPLGAVC